MQFAFSGSIISCELMWCKRKNYFSIFKWFAMLDGTVASGGTPVFAKDCFDRGELTVEHMPTDKMWADINMKPL